MSRRGGPESGPDPNRHIISCSVGGCDIPCQELSFQAPASPSFMKEIVKSDLLIVGVVYFFVDRV